MPDPETPMPRRPSEPGPAEAKAAARALLLWRVTVGAIVMAVLLLLASVAYGVVVLRQTQVVNTGKSDSRDQALDIVKDCVTTTGKCYRRGQDQYARAVGDISKANAVAAAAATSCAGQMPHASFQQVYTCTVRRVAAVNRQHP